MYRRQTKMQVTKRKKQLCGSGAAKVEITTVLPAGMQPRTSQRTVTGRDREKFNKTT